MSYLSKELGTREKLVHLSGISWWLLAPYGLSLLLVAVISIIISVMGHNIFAFTFFIVGILITLGFASPSIVRKLTTEIAITDQRVISKKGWLQILVVSTPLSKVNNINVYQSILGNLFHYGNVEVTTATTEASDNHVIRALARPDFFRNVLSEEIDKQEQSKMLGGQ